MILGSLIYECTELKIQILLFLKATCFLWSIMSEVGMMLRLLRITC
jgi:hypothetical protein